MIGSMGGNLDYYRNGRKPKTNTVTTSTYQCIYNDSGECIGSWNLKSKK